MKLTFLNSPLLFSFTYANQPTIFQSSKQSGHLPMLDGVSAGRSFPWVLDSNKFQLSYPKIPTASPPPSWPSQSYCDPLAVRRPLLSRRIRRTILTTIYLSLLSPPIIRIALTSAKYNRHDRNSSWPRQILTSTK